MCFKNNANNPIDQLNKYLTIPVIIAFSKFNNTNLSFTCNILKNGISKNNILSFNEEVAKSLSDLIKNDIQTEPELIELYNCSDNKESFKQDPFNGRAFGKRDLVEASRSVAWLVIAWPL